MNPVIVGNWKMHGRRQMVDRLSEELVAGFAEAPWGDAVQVVLCPPFPYIHRLAEGVRARGLSVGAQDCHWVDEGAYTGCVSAGMLADLWVSHVIVGHSERRQGFGESDQDVARKARAVLGAGMRPIVCCGERSEERQAGRAVETVLAQLERSLAGIEAGDAERLLVAYEPIWAIGTGATASEEDVAVMHGRIRGLLARRFGAAGESVPVLYGGSVKPGNAAALMAEKNVDGLLVGGASLSSRDFLAICRLSVEHT